MNWLQLGGSLAAILMLAWVARLLRLGESRITDPEMAKATAEAMLAGFEARDALLSGDGNAAIVSGNAGIAVLKRHGAKVAVRRLVPPLALRPAVEGVRVETGESFFGGVTLFGVIEDDVRRLEAPLTLV